MVEINLKFIWQPAGGAWCKVKRLFMLVEAGYLGDVALNEQIDAIAAEVALNANNITGFPCIHCENVCKTQQDMPTLSMLMFCQPYQMKLKIYLLLPSHC